MGHKSRLLLKRGEDGGKGRKRRKKKCMFFVYQLREGSKLTLTALLGSEGETRAPLLEGRGVGETPMVSAPKLASELRKRTSSRRELRDNSWGL